jgi:ABC-type phosphate transport system substrate-binding protein
LIILLLVTFSTFSAIVQQVAINGAAAYFSFPLIDAWRTEYQKLVSETNINYPSMGSGGGNCIGSFCISRIIKIKI